MAVCPPTQRTRFLPTQRRVQGCTMSLLWMEAKQHTSDLQEVFGMCPYTILLLSCLCFSYIYMHGIYIVHFPHFALKGLPLANSFLPQLPSLLVLTQTPETSMSFLQILSDFVHGVMS